MISSKVLRAAQHQSLKASQYRNERLKRPTEGKRVAKWKSQSGDKKGLVTSCDNDENVGAEVEEVTDADGGDVAKLGAHSPRSTS